MKKQFKIIGMTCNTCVNKITAGLQRGGFEKVIVNLDPPYGEVSLDSEIRIDAIQKIVKSLGAYQVTEIDKLDEPKTEIINQIPPSPSDSLVPLFVIATYLFGAVILRAYLSDNFSIHTLMINFMGGFFILFSLFKLLNLNGFAEAYATYDILAMKSKFYALAYPFIELTLGVLYFILSDLLYVNLTTLFLMVIGSVGVIKALRTKKSFQCACLGTALKLPMTKVTLVEDLLMGGMAFVMIIL